jgi:hypothetical protein
MLKSILRVFHTWDGTTDPLPDRVNHNEYQLTTRLGIFWPTYIEDDLIAVSTYVRCGSTLTPNRNIYQKRFVVWLRPVQWFPSLVSRVGLLK